jgi:hypothetical protein
MRSKEPVYTESTGSWVVWGKVNPTGSWEDEVILVTSEGLASRGMGYVTASQAVAMSKKLGAVDVRITRHDNIDAAELANTFRNAAK